MVLASQQKVVKFAAPANKKVFNSILRFHFIFFASFRSEVSGSVRLVVARRRRRRRRPSPPPSHHRHVFFLYAI